MKQDRFKNPLYPVKKIQVNKECILNDVWQTGNNNRDRKGYANLAEAMKAYSIIQDLAQIELCENVVRWEKFDFTGIKCQNAKLKTAALIKCLFIKIDCTNANFEKATLTSCKFQGAVLKNANFKGANLNGADFTNADLEGADLLDIKWDEETQFPNIDNVKKAKNAEKLIEDLDAKYIKRERSFSNRAIQRTVTPTIEKFKEIKELAKSFSSMNSSYREDCNNIASSYPPSPGLQKSKSERFLNKINIKDGRQEQIKVELEEKFKQNRNSQGRQ